MGQDRDPTPDLAAGITPGLTRRSLLLTALASGVSVSMASASPLVPFGRELEPSEGVLPSDREDVPPIDAEQQNGHPGGPSAAGVVEPRTRAVGR